MLVAARKKARIAFFPVVTTAFLVPLQFNNAQFGHICPKFLNDIILLTFKEIEYFFDIFSSLNHVVCTQILSFPFNVTQYDSCDLQMTYFAIYNKFWFLLFIISIEIIACHINFSNFTETVK